MAGQRQPHCIDVEREAPPGFEPGMGMADLQSANNCAKSQRKTRSSAEFEHSSNDFAPDLAKVISAWSQLSEPIRQVVLAIVENAKGVKA